MSAGSRRRSSGAFALEAAKVAIGANAATTGESPAPAVPRIGVTGYATRLAVFVGGEEDGCAARPSTRAAVCNAAEWSSTEGSKHRARAARYSQGVMKKKGGEYVGVAALASQCEYIYI